MTLPSLVRLLRLSRQTWPMVLGCVCSLLAFSRIHKSWMLMAWIGLLGQGWCCQQVAAAAVDSSASTPYRIWIALLRPVGHGW